MTPTSCRVLARSLPPRAGGETAGTIGIARGEGETIRVTTTGSELEVVATLSRDEALAFLLAGAESLGLVLLSPKDFARRQAARMKRGR